MKVTIYYEAELSEKDAVRMCASFYGATLTLEDGPFKTALETLHLQVYNQLPRAIKENIAPFFEKLDRSAEVRIEAKKLNDHLGDFNNAAKNAIK